MKRFAKYMIVSLTFFLVVCFAGEILAEPLFEEDFESYKVDDSLKGDWEVIGAVPAKPTFFRVGLEKIDLKPARAILVIASAVISRYLPRA